MLASLFGSVFWLAVTLGLLITFHEFGHFWVARRCGVKVVRFSVGFGKALWKRTARDGTEYQIAAIPLGGYVKMVDARGTDVPEEQRDHAFWAGEFTSKPVWKRILIVAAGPAFNVLFALVAFWVMFMLGVHAIAPTVNPTVTGLAQQAGILRGDRILQVDGAAVTSYEDALETLATRAVARTPAMVTVSNTQGQVRSVVLPLDQLRAGQDLGQDLQQLGLKPMPAPPIASTVIPGQPAALGGMWDGDTLVSLNGEPVRDFEQFHDQLAKAAALSSTVHVDVRRGTELRHLTLVAHQQSLNGQPVAWVIGIQSAGPATVFQRDGVFRAMKDAGKATWNGTTQTFTMLGQMLTGQASAKNVSGIIGVAQVANTSASLGVSAFLKFLALVSLSLAIVNLLPVPVLDGGYLLYCLIEVIKGSPLSNRAMQVGQSIGVCLLVALMGLAFFNDLHRLITGMA